MTRDDLKRFRALDIDFYAVDLPDGGEDFDYFCTPVGAECVGCLGWDGIHFVILPEDERVFCVDPWSGEGKYVLPVAGDFREFLSFVLFCRDANPLSQIWWMTEEQFRNLLAEDAAAGWPGSEEYFLRKDAALTAIAERFQITPADPCERVRALQAAFDPGVLRFSDEYYDTLGIERE